MWPNPQETVQCDKINKNMQRKPDVKVLYICVYDVTFDEFKTS